MPAFQHAVDLGYRYLETDVHATSDGVLVAFHDPKLDRVTTSTGAIAELPWSEVKKARINGVEPIPLMAELLSTFPDININIDVKANDTVRPLVDLLGEQQAVDRVCVGSFSDRRLAAMRDAMGPRLCTSSGPAEILRLRAASFGLPALGLTAACAQVPVRLRGVTLVDEKFVEFAHAQHLPVHVWTIDDDKEMHRLLDLGVDGIMTDDPKVLKGVLIHRNSWSK